jgi:uncharacterized protein YecE (DUF72 family)
MIRVGTSGFGYHGWSPGFYPRGLLYEDYLSYYARHFDCCELNETFFRMPTEPVLERLSALVPESFTFTVKLHRELTHERGGTFELARRFAAAMGPLSSRGQMGAVVAQFPFSFVNHPHNRAYLCRLRAALELPLVAELRNGSWRHPQTYDYLRGWGVGWVSIDAPLPEEKAPPPGLATSAVGYVRFHGRRADAFWRRGEGAERYEYRYRRRELLSWLPRVREIAKHTKDAFVIFNNRGSGHAVTNATSFAKMLRERSSRAERRRAAAPLSAG